MWATAILGLAQMGYGAYQKSQAKKAYNAIGDAPYNISQQYYDNVGLAENQAQTGYSAEAKDYYTQALQQGLSNTTSSILQAGGTINDFSKAYANYTDGLQKFAVADTTLKQSNIAKLIDTRAALAREETQQWAINKYKKSQDQKAAAAQWIQQSNNTMNQGLNTTIQGASQIGQYYMSDKAPSNTTTTAKQDNTLNPYLLEGNTASSTDFIQSNPTSIPDNSYNANLWGNPAPTFQY